MNERLQEILDYLNDAQADALIAEDRETAYRLERAITVMETPTAVDVFSDSFFDYLTKHDGGRT